MAELSSCDRDHMAHKSQNIYYLTLYSKSVPALAIRHSVTVATPVVQLLWAQPVGTKNPQVVNSCPHH